MKVDAFHYRENQDGQACDFYYNGPEYMLCNTSSKCVRPLVNGEIINDVVIGKGCVNRGPIKTTKLFEPRHCHKRSSQNITRPNIQFRPEGQRLRINCQEHHIVINGVKHGCPNYVFSLMDEGTFTIDDFTYKATRMSLSKTYTPDVPNHLNLHLGLDRREFRSITPDEIEELERKGKKLNTDEISEEVEEDDNILGLPDFSGILDTLHTFIEQIGAYLGIGISLLLLYLFCKPRRLPREVSAPISMSLLLLFVVLSPLMIEAETTTRHIKIQSNAEQTPKKIALLQQKNDRQQMQFMGLSTGLRTVDKSRGALCCCTVLCTSQSKNRMPM